MATIIKAGLYDSNLIRSDQNELDIPEIYIDHAVIQIVDDTAQLVMQFTYEELRGIMAIMAAEQEKKHIYIAAASQNN
jgi:hypothetical protein